MVNDTLQSEHSCVAEDGLLSLTGGTSIGGEDGIIMARSHVLSTVGSRDRKSFFSVDA